MTSDKDINKTQPEESNERTRRTLLRSAAVTATGISGLAAASGSAAAGDGPIAELGDCSDGWLEYPGDDYPEIDLTKEDPTHHNFDVNDWSDICIYLHGWQGKTSNVDQAYTLEQSFLQHTDHFDDPDPWWSDSGLVVAAKWESDSPVLNINGFRDAYDRAETAGKRLARWLDGQSTVRVPDINCVGHSLGGRVMLTALEELYKIEQNSNEHWKSRAIDNVALVGPAEDAGFVCTNDRYGDAIENMAGRVDNYHSWFDFAVCQAFALDELIRFRWTHGLGCGAADCWPGGSPNNFHEHDSTERVDNHCDYFTTDDDSGIEDQILENFGII